MPIREKSSPMAGISGWDFGNKIFLHLETSAGLGAGELFWFVFYLLRYESVGSELDSKPPAALH